MDKATFLELMDKYIDGTLSNADKTAFEQMINNDPMLKNEFDIQKNIRSGIQKVARREFIAELNEIKKNKGGTRIIPLSLIISVAAVLVLCIGMVLFFKQEKNTEFDGGFADFNNKESEHDLYQKEKNISDSLEYDKNLSKKNNLNIERKNKPEKMYAGSFDLKVLPVAGKLGGSNQEKIQLVLIPGNINEYKINNDTLFIYTDIEDVNSFKNNISEIVLNPQRDIEIQLLSKKLKYRLKK